ncbi:PREDICTED: probable proline--tRNA ligase, mitochondrial [Sturnus vulgaris]|uniref:probable proline--tRNA ligase, mitochondrial n=1 Tax=Sturnus vulgaris TaxID=9172 RepID=UPI00071A7B17|nr:PREDICTED: probable proline--tRNA ligase, mitochondrial [Sturnus vulgaris]
MSPSWCHPPPPASATPPGRQVAPAAPAGTIESGARLPPSACVRPRDREGLPIGRAGGAGRAPPRLCARAAFVHVRVPVCPRTCAGVCERTVQRSGVMGYRYAGSRAGVYTWLRVQVCLCSSHVSVALSIPAMEALLRKCRVLALGARQCGIRARHGGTPGRARRLLLSQLFQPLALPMGGQAGAEGRPGEPTCRSQRLMLQAGLIHPTIPGCYSYLPPTVRAMEKLIKVMDQEMQAVGGQKLNLPSLCSAELWRASGRWDQMGPELFRLVDRHNHGYCLGPTHEEVVTALVASQSGLSYKQLPLRLYQITRKFRDEPKPRFGLLRSREFYMKDMYTFDTSEEAARRTYEQVCAAYCSLFTRLGLRFVKVQAATGSIGGTTSHEFQLPADIGEDRLLLCPQGHFAANVETLNGEQTSCPTCGEKLSETKGIEVGHTFYLGTKYSSVANAQLAEMGCYGLGVTRILAASIEVLSTEDSIPWRSPSSRTAWPERRSRRGTGER